ncbi:hypothetical protein FRB90_009231, partial [Tulasnella sp. 427]
SYYIERYYRKRREIARLYKPLSGDADAYASEDDDPYSAPLRSAPLLPQHQTNNAWRDQRAAADNTKSSSGIGKVPAFKNVWDDGVENVFDVGDEDSEDETRADQRR